jgi:predicted ester cyclase
VALEEQKAIVRWGLDVLWNQGNFAVLEEALAPGSVVHDSLVGDARGIDEIGRIVRAYRTGFPDNHFSVEQQLAEHDIVATHFVATGTHTGDFVGAAPTHRGARVAGVTLCRFAGVKLVESWWIWDTLALARQLGLPRDWSPEPPLGAKN